MMEREEIYWSAENAYNAAMFITASLQVSVTLKRGDGGEFIISWTDKEIN
jgi:hypothetical protein